MSIMNKYKDLEKLKEQIINGMEIIPNVYGTEASAGKTTVAAGAMVEAYKLNGEKSHMITKERAECIEIVKKCNELAGEIIAKAFISTNKDEDIDKRLVATIKDIREYPIIVSTHSRYVDSLFYLDNEYSIDGKRRVKTKEYIDNFYNFKNFIVDEQIDLVKSSYFSISSNRLKSLLNSAKDYDGGATYNRFCKFLLPLDGYIKQYEVDNNKLKRCTKKLELENEWKEERAIRQALYSLKSKNESLVGFTIDEIENIVNGIALLYRNLKEIGTKSLSTAILFIENNSINIATYNHRIKLLLSKNNIILDASSPFMSIYNNEKMFKKIPTERLVDHSNSKFMLHVINTSTSSYRGDMGNVKPDYILKDIQKYEGKSLVVAKDNFAKIYRDYSFENYETAKAKNNYKDYDNVFITHTIRMELPYYVFCCDFYNGKLTNNLNYGASNYLKTLEFNDDKLNNIYIEYTADLWYQAIKRIQRNGNPKANYSFYTLDTISILRVYEQLANIPNPTVIQSEDSLTVFMRLLHWIQSEWKGQRLFISDLEIIFACTGKAIIEALDKCEATGAFEELGITKSKYKNSIFIESQGLKFEKYFSDFEILQKGIAKVEKKNNKRKVDKVNNLEMVKEWLINEWDRVRIPVNEVRDNLDFGRKTWDKLINSDEFDEFVKKNRIKIKTVPKMGNTLYFTVY